jgi:hypothetical protein
MTDDAKRYQLAHRIAFLETDISAQTADQEAARMGKLQQLRAEYGPEDAMLMRMIEAQTDAVAEAQREGEYDAR